MLRQTERLPCLNTEVKASVARRAKNPDIRAARVSGSSPRAVPRNLVGKLDNASLAAVFGFAYAPAVRVAPEESIQASLLAPLRALLISQVRRSASEPLRFSARTTQTRVTLRLLCGQARVLIAAVALPALYWAKRISTPPTERERFLPVVPRSPAAVVAEPCVRPLPFERLPAEGT